MVNSDLLDAVQRSLEQDGSLQAIRAQLRKGVLKVLQESSGTKPPANAVLTSFSSSEKGKNIMWMVHELLDSLGLKETLLVFEAEANCVKPTATECSAIAREYGLPNTHSSLLERLCDSRQHPASVANKRSLDVSANLNDSFESSRQSVTSSTHSPKQLSPLDMKRGDKSFLDHNPPPRAQLHALHPLTKARPHELDDKFEESFGEQSGSSHDMEALMEASSLLKRPHGLPVRVADPLPAPKSHAKTHLAPLPDLKRASKQEPKDLESSFEESTSMLQEDDSMSHSQAKSEPPATPASQEKKAAADEPHPEDDSLMEELEESVAEEEFEETADSREVLLPLPLPTTVAAASPSPNASPVPAPAPAANDSDYESESDPELQPKLLLETKRIPAADPASESESESESEPEHRDPVEAEEKAQSDLGDEDGPEHDTSDSEFSASDAAFLTSSELAKKAQPPAVTKIAVKEAEAKHDDEIVAISDTPAPGRANVQRLGASAVTRSTHGWDNNAKATDIDLRDDDEFVTHSPSADEKPRSGGGLLASLRGRNRPTVDPTPDVEEIVDVHEESASFEDSRVEVSAHLGQSLRSSNQDEEEKQDDDYEDDYDEDEVVIEHSDLDSPARPVKSAVLEPRRVPSPARNKNNISMNDDYDYGEDFEDDEQNDDDQDQNQDQDQDQDDAGSPPRKPAVTQSLFQVKPAAGARAPTFAAHSDGEDSVVEDIDENMDMSVGADVSTTCSQCRSDTDTRREIQTDEEQEWGAKREPQGMSRQRSGLLPASSKPAAGGFDALNDFDDEDDDGGFNPSAYLSQAKAAPPKPRSFMEHDDEDLIDTPKVQMRHTLAPEPARLSTLSDSAAPEDEESVNSDEFSAGGGDSGEFDMN